MNIKFKLVITVALIGVTGTANGDDRYYMMVFGSQTEPISFKYTHTFALFVKATGEGEDKRDYQLTSHTISWMPRSLQIRVLAITPEPGINLSIEESIRWAKSVGAATVMWGPFEVTQDLYEMAVKQAARLNALSISYQCIDRRTRQAGASNCIHAVSDLDTTQPLLTTGTQCGNAGSFAVIRHFQRYILPSNESNLWLCDRLKINPEDVRFVSR